ncbi:MAG: DUF1801 domain-containing protein [Paracoccaceae bacterium]
MKDNQPENVKAAFEAIPAPSRKVLIAARARLFDLAEEEGVGPLTETLKWGQPSYLTEVTKAGSTVRLALSGDTPAAFFTCSSSLVDGFRADFGDALTYQGNRAVMLKEPFPDVLDFCFVRALTYHRAKLLAKQQN